MRRFLLVFVVLAGLGGFIFSTHLYEESPFTTRGTEAPQQQAPKPAPGKDMATLVRDQGWPAEAGYTVDKSGGDTFTLHLSRLQCHAVLKRVGSDGFQIVGLYANDNSDNLTINELPPSIKADLTQVNLSFDGYGKLRPKILAGVKFC